MKGIIILLAIAAVVYADTDGICPTEQSVDWNIEKLVSHQDCNKFYICTLGNPVEVDCPVGTYFNLDLWQCDWMNNVDCTGRNDPNNPQTEELTTIVDSIIVTKPDSLVTTLTTGADLVTYTDFTTATEEPATQEPDTEDEATQEPDTEDEATQEPDTEDEATEAPAPEEPTTEVPIVTEPTNTTEVPIVTEPTNTTEAPTTTQEPETEPPVTEKVIEFQANGCPYDPHIHWLVPHEDDCNQFYYCVWGSKVVRHCPASLHFNRELQVCDWPASANCVNVASRHSRHSTMFSNLF